MKLNPIFASHMVFAADKPIRIYGEGCGQVTVAFAGLQKELCSQEAFWLVELPPMACGGPYELRVTLDGEETVLTDVCVGEVYLFAGQSNLQFKLHESTTPRETWRDDARVRLFSTERVEPGEPFVPADGWKPCRAQEAGDWSAIAYHTCQNLARRKDVAVGAIACYQGASAIEGWVPEGLFAANGICLAPEDKFPDHGCFWSADGYLYERMLRQVIPFSLSGVVWYQGESDQTLAEGLVYAQELSLLIDQWRADFGDQALPFAVIQIAICRDRADAGWLAIQQAQLDIQGLRNGVKTVISADVSEDDQIHPPTKDKLSLRVADALAELV